MCISSRRGTIVFFLCLGVGLVALAVALNVGWIILNWREGVLLFFGIVFFALIIAGMVVNTIFLVRELRRSEQHDSFINAVTHELKTPVASIRLHLETLQRRDLPESQKQEFYRLMLSDTDRLTETVEQVLRAGRAGDKKAGLEKAEVDFGQLVRECMEATRARHHLQSPARTLPGARRGLGRAGVLPPRSTCRPCRRRGRTGSSRYLWCGESGCQE
jgi:signal transduction histidine kinase